jgi:hypothetical protein
MRTRRLVLTLLAVGLMSAVCWVSVWAWGNAWRDVGGTRMTFAGGYAPGYTNNYSMRVTGNKLVCIDIDSNVIHACDTSTLNQTIGGNTGLCPQTPTVEQNTLQCDPMVTVNCTFPGGPFIADDLWYVPPANAVALKNGSALPQPTAAAPINNNGPWNQDYDPFLCFVVPASSGVATCQIQVGGATPWPGTFPSGCNYYMMTITSTPWKNAGLLTPVGVGTW